jgi:hypothetical protein
MEFLEWGNISCSSEFIKGYLGLLRKRVIIRKVIPEESIKGTDFSEISPAAQQQQRWTSLYFKANKLPAKNSNSKKIKGNSQKYHTQVSNTLFHITLSFIDIEWPYSNSLSTPISRDIGQFSFEILVQITLPFANTVVQITLPFANTKTKKNTVFGTLP